MCSMNGLISVRFTPGFNVFRQRIGYSVFHYVGGSVGVTEGMESGPEPSGPRSRKSDRVALSAEVQLRRRGRHHYVVNVHDISPEGCRLEFVERPRLDETVWVKFKGLDAIESNVCWMRDSEAGIEFARPIHPAVFDVLLKRLDRS